MTKKIKKRQIKQTKKSSISPFTIYWEKKNYLLLILGLVITIIGFFFMTIGPWNSFSSLVISPIILFIAYIIIFPLSIFYRRKEKREQSQDSGIDSGQS